MTGLGFEVWDVQLRMQGLECRGWSLRCWRSGFVVQGFEVRVQGSGPLTVK